MKHKLTLLLLVPMIMTAAGCTKQNPKSKGEKPVDVVIISGQSNAVGCTRSDHVAYSLGEDKYDEFSNGYDSIQIAYDNWTKDWPASGITFYPQNTSKHNSFVKTALGQGNGIGTFGPEIGIAEKNHEKRANKLFLIKFACGGSNLKDDWLSRKSPMYPKLVDYVKLQMNNLVEMGYKPTIKAFCWMQGEGDSYVNYFQVYQENLREFVSHIREDFKDLAGNKDIPFIDAGINESTMWDYPKEVNDAKRAFAAENELNIFIDTMAAGMHTNQEPMFGIDEYHYDSDSEVLLGNLFADAFEPFLSPIEE